MKKKEKLEAIRVIDKCRADGQRFETQMVYLVGEDVKLAVADELVRIRRAVACDPKEKADAVKAFKAREASAKKAAE